MSERFFHLSDTQVVNMRHIIRAERSPKQLTLYLTGPANDNGMRPSMTVAIDSLDERGKGEMFAMFANAADY